LGTARTIGGSSVTRKKSAGGRINPRASVTAEKKSSLGVGRPRSGRVLNPSALWTVPGKEGPVPRNRCASFRGISLRRGKGGSVKTMLLENTPPLEKDWERVFAKTEIPK